MRADARALPVFLSRACGARRLGGLASLQIDCTRIRLAGTHRGLGWTSLGARRLGHFEATYSLAVTAWLSLQPDFQYVVNPGGEPGRPDAVVIAGRIPDADASVLLPIMEELGGKLGEVRSSFEGYNIAVTGLSAIAARYNVSVAKLKAVNGMRNSVIRVGQTLTIPSG